VFDVSDLRQSRRNSFGLIYYVGFAYTVAIADCQNKGIFGISLTYKQLQIFIMNKKVTCKAKMLFSASAFLSLPTEGGHEQKY
jgi:hypothetical protein